MASVFQFKHPFTCIIAGPTQAGKTCFVTSILKRRGEFISPPPGRIVWCRGQEQKSLDVDEGVEIYEGLESLADVEFDWDEQNLLVLDDLMEEAGVSKMVQAFFTKISHHKNVSVMMLVQNVFHQSRYMRNMSLNSQYIVMFKNPRDQSQIYPVAYQAYPQNSQYLVEAFWQATFRPYGYLVLDFKQEKEEGLRVASDILDGEDGFFYLSEKEDV